MFRIGVDCEEIARFRRLSYKRNEKFYRKIFTPQEIKYCVSYRDPYPRFAVRFAAKEATFKALNGLAKPSYNEIEIQRDKRGQPNVCITKSRFKRRLRLAISLSLTHSKSHAVAFVIATDGKSGTKNVRQALKKSSAYIIKKIRR